MEYGNWKARLNVTFISDNTTTHITILSFRAIKMHWLSKKTLVQKCLQPTSIKLIVTWTNSCQMTITSERGKSNRGDTQLL